MKSQSRYLALLRGINVGGNNIIAKDDLRECFESLGYSRVRTYIQSGNILFRASKSSTRELTADIEAALSRRFSYAAQAVVLSHGEFIAAVGAAHESWGHDDDCKHNAMFLFAGTSPEQVLGELPPPKSDIETVTRVPGALFWSISKAKQSRTTMMQLAKHRVYRSMTVRNHNTVFKLCGLFEEL